MTVPPKIPPFSIPGRCRHPSITREPGPGHNPIHFMGTRQVRWSETPGTHVLAIQTAQRPKKDTLNATISSLDEAGIKKWAGPKLIVSDGCTPPTPEGWILNAGPPPPAGSSRTFMRLLRAAIQAAPDLSRLTYLQDDVILCKNTLDYINKIRLDDDVSFISWYSTWSTWNEAENSRLPLLKLGRNACFGGNQAITIPRSTIDILLPFLESGAWPYRSSSDRVFAATMKNGMFAAHYPVIVQHIASASSNSICTPRHHGEWKSMQFTGIEFDALSLMASIS